MKHVLLFCFLLSPLLLAEEATLREQLREALYTEEVTRDPAAAAKQYEKLLADFRDRRPLAATALFRLAEVRRKQDRKEEAIAHYQRLLQDFPDFETEAKLARENLAALGAKPAEATPTATDEESAELQRLQHLATTAPDILRDPATLDNAIGHDWPLVVEFLLANGAKIDDFLSVVAKQGNLGICRILVEKGKPTPEQGIAALTRAIREDRFAVLTYLLESGISPNGSTPPFAPPLHIAVETGHFEAVKLLVRHGADIDTMVEMPEPGVLYSNHEIAVKRVPNYAERPTLSSLGTAMHQAVRFDQLDICRFLLEQGAKPDLPTPTHGLTPLHFAAAQNPPNGDASLGLLLSSGAAPNRRTKLEVKPDLTALNHFVNTTPLEIALKRNDTAKLTLLLKHGANPNTLTAKGNPLLFQTSTQKLKLLLDAGADPNLLDAHGRPMLGLIPDVEIAGLLLQAGADPNIPFGKVHLDQGQGCDDPFAEKPGEVLVTTNSALWEASRKASDFPVFKALLNAGARPGPALGYIIPSVARWDEDGSAMKKLLEFRPDRFNPAEIPTMTEWDPAARDVYLQQLIYPEIRDASGIQFLFLHYGITAFLTTAEKKSRPPSLARLMLDHFDFVTRPRATTGDQSILWCTLQIVRRNDEGIWTAHPLELTSDDPLPELQWGDIITADPTPKMPVAPGLIDPSEFYQWHLGKRIKIPISVKIDGKSRPLMLHGALLVYDPTKGVAPLLDAARLAKLLVPEYDAIEEALVKRADWDDICVIGKTAIPSEFPFQEGDQLAITTKETSQTEHVS